ncbi:Uncharacterised protein [Serratia ficaria]|uniref:hypothetical protein n=1 Tax=Serratia ficaria TaxID=61651 RepID=UPI0021797F5D|nr:hypothetical protein [Serratia ficaria]CAI1781416.1 Uncharacterised protein [Serratia ficaria]
MKIAIIIFFVLTLISALMQYFCHRRHKDELIVLYHKYTQSGHPLPPFVVIADNLGLIGVSLKAQWFRWVLNGRKLKIDQDAWLDKNAHDFVQKNASQRLKNWIRKDFTLSLLKIGSLVLMCVCALLSKV